MKRRILLIVGFVLCYSPILHARTNGTYLGIGLAQATAHIESMTFGTLPYSYLFTGSPTFFKASQDNNSRSSSWGLYGGYQFNRYISIEALYQPLGEYTRSASNYDLVDLNLTSRAGFGTTTFLNISDTDRLRLQGYGLTVLGNLPVADYIYLFGKVGSFYWDGTLDRITNASSTTLNKTVVSTETDSGFSPIYGVGMRIDVTRSLSVRGEWSKISSIGGSLSTGKSNVNITSFSAQINY